VVETLGATLRVPEAATSPRPSIEAVVALVVFQLSVTCSPAVIAAGEAVRFAVGAGGASGGAVATGVCTLCLQPAKAISDAASRAPVKNLVFKSKAILLQEQII
jgi:hypothetical protein